MARKALIEKSKKTPKFSVRKRNRCGFCGRPRAYMRFFDMCRLCFRKFAVNGELPGIKKCSW